jgi:hypothetical protein
MPPDHCAGALRAIDLVAVRQWLSCGLAVEKYEQSTLDPEREQYSLEIRRFVKRITGGAHMSVSARGERRSGPLSKPISMTRMSLRWVGE